MQGLPTWLIFKPFLVRDSFTTTFLHTLHKFYISAKHNRLLPRLMFGTPIARLARSRSMRLRRYSFFAMVVALILGMTLPVLSLQAQDSSIIVTLSVPTFSRDAYSDQLISQFETAHPGVKINIIKNDAQLPSATSDVNAYLTALQDYASSADVLTIDFRRTPITESATRAGLLLDLAPIVNADKTLNVEDFYPAVWNAYQWDKGIWALPTAADAIVMAYDP